ncbi:DNA replication/repair protein RecF [Roseibium limicola]|uniref:DNA replication and repair protein RecF n=1 Tax=Roseibium limicola TaxID=2816037 RepID=A0A939J9H5_9HYPH|nr:DNA replication/repair protein RecF [Roseibium limicola]
MVLTRLTLTDFRNYEQLDLAFHQPLVAFVGNNGIGKTNILEAISFLTAGRGLRRATLASVARMSGPGGWSLAARVDRDGYEHRVGTGLASGESGRRVRIDGEDAKSSEALLDYLRVLWLVPSMDGLFTGPGGDRRRFLDRLTLSLDPAHGRRVTDFDKALRQRNRLLEQGGRADVLSAIERQVSSLGMAVSSARNETVRLLSATLAEQERPQIAFPRASLSLEGQFEAQFTAMPAVDAEDLYMQALSDARPRDRAAGRTLLGPHLSDLAVHHAAKDMPAAQSSTGEQKALLIGLILAHADLTERMTGQTPVLLLDEVAAHLDPERRKSLFDTLLKLGGQVFMTGTDASLFEALPPQSSIFRIDDEGATALTWS